MGFWADFKKDEEKAEAKRIAKKNGTYVPPAKPLKKKTDYHPSKEKDGVIRADIYSTYGTHDLDKWFEQGAPHLTDAIYQIRDDTKRQQAKYDELQKHYDDLEKKYDNLQKQYEKMTDILEIVASNTSR